MDAFETIHRHIYHQSSHHYDCAVDIPKQSKTPFDNLSLYIRQSVAALAATDTDSYVYYNAR